LTSLRNPRVQEARKLHRRAFRDKQGRFLAEGPLVVAEALRSDADVLEVFVDVEGAAAETATLAEGLEVPVTPVSRRVATALSSTSTPQGVVAVVRSPSVPLEEVGAGASLVVVLADVRDPGNAGTLIRAATAAGADAVVFAEGAVDPLNPKTVRASAGTLFRIPLVRQSELGAVLSRLRDAGLRVMGAAARAHRSIYELDMTGRLALVLGNEAWGIASEARPLLDDEVGIPMPGPAESVNVGMAGSVILFEIVRQRTATR
jgi:RNA methyltransferase, TrmH family